jgi:lipopolysaccharide export system permease protein
MSRLTPYLLKLFLIEALALFGVAGFLLFLIQTLRLLDSVALRGQGLTVLIGQSLLGIPSLSAAFLYVCLGIGLGRSLRNLQASSELGALHINRLLPALLRAITLYALIGALALLLITHILTPLSNATSARWAQSIAADIVGRSLVPHKFTDLVPGVTISITSRSYDGRITGFFADDRRTAGARRTYIADSALIAEDERGYVLQLRDGVVQYQTSASDFSEFSFSRYDLTLDRLTAALPAPRESRDQASSIELIAAGVFDDSTVAELIRRSAEALRALGICLLVTVLAGFPRGSRFGGGLPIELVVLSIAFLERGFTAYGPFKGPASSLSGGLLLLLVAGVLLLIRLRTFQRMPRLVSA